LEGDTGGLSWLPRTNTKKEGGKEMGKKLKISKAA